MKRATWLSLTPDERRSYADPARQCIERGCDQPAGTPWGPHWCADHDDERLNRIDGQLREISRSLAVASVHSEAP